MTLSHHTITAAPESSHQYVDVGAASIRVRTLGAGEPLLMMNGLGAYVGMWKPLAVELARHRRVIMFDAPGCGRSSTLRVPRRMNGLAELVGPVLDALDIEDVDVLGYSWGGALAQQFAHDHPHRVRRLILASTTPGLGGHPPSLKVMGLMTTPLRYFSPGFMKHAEPHIYGGSHRLPMSQRPRTTELWAHRPPNPIGYGHQLYAISGWSSLNWLDRVNARTLVLGGDDDPLAPVANAHLMADNLPNAELRVIPGAGHLWLIGRPEESSALVEDFLRGPRN